MKYILDITSDEDHGSISSAVSEFVPQIGDELNCYPDGPQTTYRVTRRLFRFDEHEKPGNENKMVVVLYVDKVDK